MFLSDIEVVLGQLSIANWGETIFDYLPNLMYIGEFEADSPLTFRNALFISDNNASNIPTSDVSLRQIHFPRLVEVPAGNATFINSPDLCYVGNLEFYFRSSNQKLIYRDQIKPYNECGMYVHVCHFFNSINIYFIYTLTLDFASSMLLALDCF